MDYNARTPLLPEAVQAMQNAFDYVGNPSSPHGAGRSARNLVENARVRVARFCGADPHHVIFTSSGTEANALAMRIAPQWFVSAIEHASLVKNASEIVSRLPVDENGVLNLEAAAREIAAVDRPYVSVLYANNETGVIQPIAEIARLVKTAGGFIHCDAVQAAGKLPLDMKAMGVDALSLSAHKIGGPPGMGALVLASDHLFSPLIKGGGQEFGQRAGTENIIAIAGFAAAIEAAPRLHHLAAMRDQIEAHLPDRAIVFGKQVARLNNTSCFALPDMPSEKSLILFDLAGIHLSAGAACASGKIEASEVLLAQGVSLEYAQSALRVSLGWQTTPLHIDRFIETMQAITAQKAA